MMCFCALFVIVMASLYQMFLNEEDNANPDCVWLRAWFPVMFELSTVITRCKLDVRTRYISPVLIILHHYYKLIMM